MIKNYSLLVLLFIVSLIAKAQPVLNASDFETELSMTVYKGNSSGLSPGDAGANQTWDFSSLSLTLRVENQTFNTVAVGTAISASSFTDSNYCWTTKGTDDINNNIIIDIYLFYNLSDTSFEEAGSSYPGTINKFTDTKTLFQFPYNYNKKIDDTYQIEGQNSNSFTSVYDAYGTLITPFGTYTNVIRVKTTRETYVNYTWYQTKPFSIIMQGEFTDSSPLTVYKNTTGLGVNPIEPKKAMAVFPNPTHAELNIQLPEQQTLDRVAITDITGKIVLTQDQNLNQINVAHLANGLYFIEAHSGNEKFQTKFIKN
jgi:hypothetical protein